MVVPRLQGEGGRIGDGHYVIMIMHTTMHALVYPVTCMMVGTPSLPASIAFALAQSNVLFGGTRVFLLANALAPTP